MSLGCRRVYKWVGRLSGRITPFERQACVWVCSSLVSRTVTSRPSILDPLLSCQLNLLVWMSQRKLQGHRCHWGFTGPKPQSARSPPWLLLLAIRFITSIPTPGKSKVSLLSASYKRAWRTVASWCPLVSKLILTIPNFSYIISFLL